MVLGMRCLLRKAPWLLSVLTLAACSSTSEGRRVGPSDPASVFDDGGTSAEPSVPESPPNDVPPDPETLFDAPSGTPTANSIHGSWAEVASGKAMPGIEDRLWIGVTKMMLARRCTHDDVTVLVSVTAAIRLDATRITILESKNETKDLETPDFSTSCTAGFIIASFEYVVRDLTLSFPATRTSSAEELIKLSD